MKGVWRKIFGIVLVLFGIISLILPVLPGAVIIFIGAELLGFKFLLWERFKGYLLHARFKKRDSKETRDHAEDSISSL